MRRGVDELECADPEDRGREGGGMPGTWARAGARGAASEADEAEERSSGREDRATPSGQGTMAEPAHLGRHPWSHRGSEALEGVRGFSEAARSADRGQGAIEAAGEAAR